MPISDRKLWACANEVLRQHGDRAAEFVAETVAALAACDDRKGVNTWIAIADRIDQLSEVSPAGQTRH